MEIGPNHEWFRPITMHKLAKSGDYDRWMIVGEPVRGKIAGAGFQVTGTEVVNLLPDDVNELINTRHRVAMSVVWDRIRNNDWFKEGSTWQELTRPVRKMSDFWQLYESEV